MQEAFTQSNFVPVALGFFGLGLGYLVVGGSQIIPAPAIRNASDADRAAMERSFAAWMVWMPGFLQFMTGVILFVGLTWFDVFEKTAPLYMAALAFTAYGVHWFVLGYRRWSGANSAPEGFMALAFIVLSVLGVIVFMTGGRDVPVGILFIFLTLIYVFEAPTKMGFLSEAVGGKLVAWLQFLAGIYLMYLVIGVTLNITSQAGWWV